MDVVSIDVYLPEYQSTDYADAYEKLVAATSHDKVAALAEVGYLPNVDLLQKKQNPLGLLHDLVQGILHW